MRIIEENGQYTLYKEQEAIGTAVLDGQAIRQFEIAPQWRGRGYGSYLLKEILRRGWCPAGAPPRAGFVRRAALPRISGGAAGPGRTVCGCHLRERP